jgi:hypothetical protein
VVFLPPQPRTEKATHLTVYRFSPTLPSSQFSASVDWPRDHRQRIRKSHRIFGTVSAGIGSHVICSNVEEEQGEEDGGSQ